MGIDYVNLDLGSRNPFTATQNPTAPSAPALGLSSAATAPAPTPQAPSSRQQHAPHNDPPPYYDYAQFAAPPPGFVAAPYVPQAVPHSQNLNLIATAQATGINPNRLPGYNNQPAYFCGRYGQPMPPTYDAAYSMNGMNGMSQSYYAIPTHRDEGGITYSVRIPQNELRHRRVMSYISLVFFVVIFVLFFVFMFSTLRHF